MIGLSEKVVRESDEHKLHRLLEIFFSPELAEEEKKEIMENEYDIEISDNIERSVREMCNVSEGLVNRCLAKGLEQGIAQGLEQGLEQGAVTKLINLVIKKVQKGKSLAQIADELETDIEEITPIYEAVLQEEPEYDVERILEKLKK